MTTFLRLELASTREAGDTYPPTPVLINVAHITRIHPSYRGARIILNEPPEGPGLEVTATLDEIQTLMQATNGRITVKSIWRTPVAPA